MIERLNKHARLALVLIVVFAIVHFSESFFNFSNEPTLQGNSDKFSEILGYISNYYVDDVDWDNSYKGAIDGMLSKLDPHSVYIDAEDSKEIDENFSGKYQGIGIQFDMIESYLTVIAPIPGSPSEMVGLTSGDRILKIDGVSAIGITTKEVQNRLKGEPGTSVVVAVSRDGVDGLMDYTIIRDEIPIFTVNTYFVENDGTGYLLLNRFAKTTENEVENAMREMESNGMKRLILDLRWNAGGYLDQAVNLASRFLEGNKRIVYTKGRIREWDKEYFSDNSGAVKYWDLPLIVMINGASASASEIVAGAIQDYDRGLIVGTTSFGKGLVQSEFPLDDGSRLRLTISKYYTPSGRLIQRPYENKDIVDYYTDRLDSLDNRDSLENRPKFHTECGRIVYGGGGITPDVKIEYDAVSKSPELTAQLVRKRIFFEVASQFVAGNGYLKSDVEYFMHTFKADKNLLNSFRKVCVDRGINIDADAFEKDRTFIQNRLKAEIARILWDSERYYRALLEGDNQYETARSLFTRISTILSDGVEDSEKLVGELLKNQ